MPVFPVGRVSAMGAAAIDPMVLLVRLKATTALSADERRCAQMKIGVKRATTTTSRPLKKFGKGDRHLFQTAGKGASPLFRPAAGAARPFFSGLLDHKIRAAAKNGHRAAACSWRALATGGMA